MNGGKRPCSSFLRKHDTLPVEHGIWIWWIAGPAACLSLVLLPADTAPIGWWIHNPDLRPAQALVGVARLPVVREALTGADRAPGRVTGLPGLRLPVLTSTRASR